EQHARRHTVPISLEPARRAQAPAVAGHEAGEAELRLRGRQVVAAEAGEPEERRRDLDTYSVRAHVLGAGVAAAVPKEAGQRALAACLERLAEHVDGFIHGRRRGAAEAIVRTRPFVKTPYELTRARAKRNDGNDALSR